MRTICVIPARMGSSRFPGKPLADLLGLPLIVHVLERCRLNDSLERVVVATCDQVIFDAVEKAGGEAVMTADTHERCTDRVAEAIGNMDLSLADDDLVLMVQGDEALMTPEMAEQVIESYRTTGTPVVNLMSRLYRQEDLDDPNAVKAVARPDGMALYFSRAAIPCRYRAEDAPAYQQTGVIGLSASFLQTFNSLPQTPLEIIESIDMNRVLEHGHPLQLVHTERETVSVDTPDDLARAVDFMRSDVWTARYLSAA